MTSLELHEYMTPEQHQRWMLMPEDIYDKAKEDIERMLSDSVIVYTAIDTVDKAYKEAVNLDIVPF